MLTAQVLDEVGTADDTLAGLLESLGMLVLG